MGVSYTTLNNLRNKLGWEPVALAKAKQLATGEEAATVIPQPPAPDVERYHLPAEREDCTDWLRITGDRLILSDLHVPYHSKEVLEDAVRRAVKAGVTRFLIAGDFLDANQFSRRGQQKGFQPSAQEDVKDGRTVFKWLLQHMDGGEVIMGNHDAWFESYMAGHFDPEFILPSMYECDQRITFSRYEQCELVSGGKEYRVLHGANYSAENPLGVAKKLAAKFLQNIIMGHQHHPEQGRDRSGRFRCICLGGCYDASRLMYLHKSPRTNPHPMPSYCIVKDGWVRVFEPGEPD